MSTPYVYTYHIIYITCVRIRIIIDMAANVDEMPLWPQSLEIPKLQPREQTSYSKQRVRVRALKFVTTCRCTYTHMRMYVCTQRGIKLVTERTGQ